MKENYWKIENEIATIESRDIDESFVRNPPKDDIDWIYALKDQKDLAYFKVIYKDGLAIDIFAEVYGELNMVRTDNWEDLYYGSYSDVKELVENVVQGRKTLDEAFAIENNPWIELIAIVNDEKIELCDVFSGPFAVFSSLKEVVDTLSNPENLKLIRDEVERVITVQK